MTEITKPSGILSASDPVPEFRFLLLESSRLIFRPVEQADVAFLCDLQQDTEVMKYIGRGGARTLEQTQSSLDRALAQRSENPNFGMWILAEKSSLQPVGNFILREPSTLEKVKGIEIGFSFASRFWGLGFATESIQRMLKHLANSFPAHRAVALTHLDNAASQKTLLKSGFHADGLVTYHDPSSDFSQESALFVHEG